MVVLLADLYLHKIGTGDFFGAFFDNIAHHLEGRKWGSRFPIVMGEFYDGELKYENLDKAKKELEQIREEFKKFKPSEVIWDFNDLTKRPPWGDNIADHITSLSNYFAVSDKSRDLFEVIFEAIQDAKDLKSSVIIDTW